eukprot:TRINITY_DN9451_c0_g1_i1.p1 TRINITY_DN9451_c0_g1~~TRINITY_DN9451_c0_g1_i1.p1  ORF type:complete len:101 (+),score=9.49 TRINITY_DN9451_c0_g1_i1:111-413(+)
MDEIVCNFLEGGTNTCIQHKKTSLVSEGALILTSDPGGLTILYPDGFCLYLATYEFWSRQKAGSLECMDEIVWNFLEGGTNTCIQHKKHHLSVRGTDSDI